MKTKHTSGPWRKQGNIIFGKTIGESVARLYALGSETEKANANLIVTAPELLEALKEASDYIADCFDLSVEAVREGPSDDEHDLMARILCAIRKAEGGKA